MIDPKPPTTRCVVDNRVFLHSLDELYRLAIKVYEREELLRCARRVAETLDLHPADVPIEGYYAEEETLTEYFRLMRALQKADQALAGEVDHLSEYHRLLEVTGSPIFGHSPEGRGYLLPRGRDALWHALLATKPEWTVERVSEVAYRKARELDDISLVGLAALPKDPVMLAALRESVVLYADMLLTGVPAQQPKVEYVWQVDEFLASQATRFVEAFNELFLDELPVPEAANAKVYWGMSRSSKILGRCVRIGLDDSVSPVRHYHWAICRGSDGEPVIQEFWSEELWTTSRYRDEIGAEGKCLEL